MSKVKAATSILIVVVLFAWVFYTIGYRTAYVRGLDQEYLATYAGTEIGIRVFELLNANDFQRVSEVMQTVIESDLSHLEDLNKLKSETDLIRFLLSPIEEYKLRNYAIPDIQEHDIKSLEGRWKEILAER